MSVKVCPDCGELVIRVRCMTCWRAEVRHMNAVDQAQTRHDNQPPKGQAA